ncbi:MAG: hypothetical protein ACI9SB_001410 [Candidatus Azotimanducaceae bacterium]|jgi:hypothetical protein
MADWPKDNRVTDVKISEQTHAEAMKIARSTQRPGQTKEQTKLIAQGIEKGIAEYKKQQKVKARERDKQRKKDLRAKATSEDVVESTAGKKPYQWLYWLPWLGMAVTVFYFAVLPQLSQ